MFFVFLILRGLSIKKRSSYKEQKHLSFLKEQAASPQVAERVKKTQTSNFGEMLQNLRLHLENENRLISCSNCLALFSSSPPHFYPDPISYMPPSTPLQFCERCLLLRVLDPPPAPPKEQQQKE